MASERVVRVSLTAQINGYLAGMDAAAKKTRETASETDRLKARLEAQQKAMQTTGKGMLVAGGLVAAGLALAVKKAAEFDQAMSAVQAATHAGAREMSRLREAAIDVSRGTKFSATEAAGAIEELSKAGVSTKAILGGALKGSLDLAAAGAMSVADAAGVASTTLKQFGIDESKAGHVADVLAAGAGKAMGDVSDLSQALSQSGTVASQFGISLDETVGVLAEFASKGMLGSDAGTAFRTMLLRLANPSGEAAAKMKELGINAYDAGGKFVGMSGLAGQLQQGLKGLTQEQQNAALSIIFGQDAIRGANILFSEGAKGVKDWTGKVNDAGYAGETAAARLDNLNGDLGKLRTALDNAFIGIGEGGTGPLRDLTQSVTGAVNGFAALPEGAQTAAFWVGSVGSAATIASGAFFLGVPKVAAYRKGLGELGTTAQKVGSIVGSVGKAAGIAGGVAAGVTIVSSFLVEYQRTLRGTDDAVAKATTTNTTFLQSMKDLGVAAEPTAASVKKALDALASGNVWGGVGTDIQTLRDALTELGNGLESLPVDQAVGRVNAWRNELHLTDTQFRTLLKDDSLKGFRDAIQKQLAASGDAADQQAVLNYILNQSHSAAAGAAGSAKGAAQAYQDQANKASGLRQALAELMDSMNASNDANSTAIAANAAWRQGLASLDDQVKQNGTSLDQATTKGSANADMLSGLAGKAQDAAKAQYEVDKTTMGSEAAAGKYQATLKKQRDKFIEAADAAGFNRDQVKKLADQVFKMPSAKEIKILADTDGATNTIRDWMATINGKRVHVFVDAIGGTTYNVNPGTWNPKMKADGGLLDFYAGGGIRRENHLAEIAPAGSWRVWAEPETGGEAYIPLADGKRARSARILAQVAAQFGGQYVGPDGVPVQAFADGGMIAAQKAVKDAEARQRARQREYDRDRSDRNKARLEDAKQATRDARQAFDDARQRLREQQDDFRRSVRRGQAQDEDPYALIDQLNALGHDVGGKRGKALRDKAAASERRVIALTKAQEKNNAAQERARTVLERVTDKLADLKDKAASMAASVSAAIRGIFNVSDLGKPGSKTVTKTATLDGVRVETSQQVAVPVSAASIASTIGGDAAKAKAFAEKLEKLKAKGLNPKLLAEIAGAGIEEGGPIADALLKASAGQIKDINRNYTALGKYSDLGGQTVADANFKTQIDLAQKAVDKAQATVDTLEDQGKRLRDKLEAEVKKLISGIVGGLKTGTTLKRATGGRIYGPGTGTSDSIRTLTSNGEYIISERAARNNYAALDQLNRTGRLPAFTRPVYANQSGAGGTVIVREQVPTHLTVVDKDGILVDRMKVVATDVTNAAARDSTRRLEMGKRI